MKRTDFATPLKVGQSPVVLITGTSSGFGWLAANSCAQLGHRVYATMRDTKGRNAFRARALAEFSNVNVLELDVTNGQSVMDAVTMIIEKEGRIDVAVNNAGVFATGITETFTDGDLDRVMDVDLKGPWRVIRAVLPHMRRRGDGLIINMSSVAGRFSPPFMSAYNAAKFAVEGLTEGLHFELKPLGVDVVMIQPGAFPTEIFARIVTGSDSTVISGYGELAKVPEQLEEGIAQMFEALKPDPQLVADAIVGLINTAPGERPLRTVVDPVTGNFAEKANREVKEQFENFMSAIGMGSMLDRA
jgi:NAD(P)-dependent dehydrogenase (short-subunit alcohol dehydrogenase family)